MSPKLRPHLNAARCGNYPQAPVAPMFPEDAPQVTWAFQKCVLISLREFPQSLGHVQSGRATKNEKLADSNVRSCAQDPRERRATGLDASLSSIGWRRAVGNTDEITHPR